MLTRRELVVAGGLVLAGRLLPFPPRGRLVPGPAVEIAMRSSDGGARVQFDPQGVLVRPGSTVRWVTVEGVHTTTAYHPAHGDLPRRIPEEARPWESGYLVEPGETFEVTLEIPGVYDYFCRPHEAAGMVGRIVVAPASVAESIRSAPGASHPWERYEDGGLPKAALEGFPSVTEILQEGSVDRARR